MFRYNSNGEFNVPYGGISYNRKDFSKKIDWNYNTIVSTAQKFDILRPKHPELNLEKFWQAILRGGIQAAVYFSDSIKS
jgi:site-specific DNA-adenine methylase